MKGKETNDARLESTINRLRRLPPEVRELAVSMIDRLAQAEGVSAVTDCRPPAENLEAWVTKMRSERKAERTIRLYSYQAQRFLEHTPTPTRADVRGYLARRIEETSPSAAETERKALASLFSFLHAEGLWHENPLEGVRAVGIRWGKPHNAKRGLPSVKRVSEVRLLRRDAPTEFNGTTRRESGCLTQKRVKPTLTLAESPLRKEFEAS
ncbi:MAG: phage integrase N-terminal SAM-like domain-containing protein [Dehalococcoidales bacterium]|nr:MAG: phage integrase N-terminal SAM-like domain-containing protein [Dehalococcoidales bacterium]